MLGIPILPIDPVTLGGGSLLLAVIATALIVVLVVGTWAYFRRQPAGLDIPELRRDDVQLPKAA
jgi:hypothetical protein